MTKRETLGPKLFTIEEAEALIPLLRTLFSRFQDLHFRYEEAGRELAVLRLVAASGGSEENPDLAALQAKEREQASLLRRLKTVQREVESGISSKAPLGVRLQEQWRSLRDRTLGEWLLPGVVIVIALAVLLSIALRPAAGSVIPGLIFPGIAGLLIWRRFRHRRLRLARRLVAKVRKMPEVRLVTLDGMRFTVVADRAQAKTYVRANALLDSVNSSMFFGDAFTLVVREEVTPEEEKALLSSPGVLYVREAEAPPTPLPGRST